MARLGFRVDWDNEMLYINLPDGNVLKVSLDLGYASDGRKRLPVFIVDNCQLEPDTMAVVKLGARRYVVITMSPDVWPGNEDEIGVWLEEDPQTILEDARRFMEPCLDEPEAGQDYVDNKLRELSRFLSDC